MKIFVDTAKLEEIEKAHSYGILDGVTTNPSLIKKAVSGKNLNMSDYIKKILRAAEDVPVSLEVIGNTYEEMVAEAKMLYRKFNPVSGNVYVKIPVNPSFGKTMAPFDGIKAIRSLSKVRIPVNCTLIFTPEQALLAARAGAKFVSPFAGRVDDYIRKKNGIPFKKEDYFPACGMEYKRRLLEDRGIVSGIDLVRECVEILEVHNLKTEVLAASMRNTQQVREAALAGAHIATLPLRVLGELLAHPKTEEGMKNFTRDVVPEYAELLKK